MPIQYGSKDWLKGMFRAQGGRTAYGRAKAKGKTSEEAINIASKVQKEIEEKLDYTPTHDPRDERGREREPSRPNPTKGPDPNVKPTKSVSQGLSKYWLLIPVAGAILYYIFK